ncbi:hypothetical protein [Phycicoccus sonneratiae]|uniref:Uncharacterized protein n=1 Tax=Phycicoccus sonneratiae TaxID=2807628 RepID=A0ABS2CL89_9MICO|nr:hypothetical protein [Phycicoccus sonneraticus]MBM6400647.1 hypothetical protein [Phycicoccus sonneraticus]
MPVRRGRQAGGRRTGQDAPMQRFSGLVWTGVGVLVIVAVLWFVLPRV